MSHQPIKLSDYIYTDILNLDLSQQKNNALRVEEYVLSHFKSNDKDYKDKSTKTTTLYTQYNYLLYPLIGMSSLYEGIRKTFHFCVRDDVSQINPEIYDEYSIQCWLNVYNKGDYIDWHRHWPLEFHSWHGFYCVDVEPNSYTSYKIDGRQEIVSVESENDLIVMSRSGRDLHRSSEWEQDYPRITVAFDIVPTKLLHETDSSFKLMNHWIPI